MKIALVTCERLAELDREDHPLFEKLKQRLHEVNIVKWTDTSVRWNDFDYTLVRSTWDYHLKAEAFISWVRKVSQVSTLVNSASIIEWNAHKHYLRELQARGVPVVATIWATNTVHSLQHYMTELQSTRLVLKPAIGAGAHGFFKVNHYNVAQGELCFSKLLESTEVMVQAELLHLNTFGERSIIVINQRITHAVICRFSEPGLRTDGSHTCESYTPSNAERALVERVLCALPEMPLYARVDLVLDNNKQLCVMEVELIEPNLYFSHAPASVEAFVAALEKVSGD